MGKKILVLISANDGVNYHRLLAPYSQIPGTEFVTSDVNTLKDIDFSQYKALIFNRAVSILPNVNKAVITAAKKARCKIIMDIDDYWIYPKGHPLKAIADEIKESVEYNLKQAHYITTTTKALQNIIPRESVLIKNAINPATPQFSLEKNIHDYNSVSTIAGENHRKNAVQGVEFISGYNPQSYAASYWDKGIIVVPTPYSKMNSFKSELKLIEAGHFSKAVICHDILPYREFIPGIHCLKNEVLKNIEILKKDKDLQDHLRKNLNNFINKYFIFEKENEKRVNLLK